MAKTAAECTTMAEIRADKDQLRAEFAMSTRRLEMSVEQMKAKTTNQLAELSKKGEAINKLKAELGEKTAATYAMEARERAVKDQLRATEEEFTQRLNTLREAERNLADTRAALDKTTADVFERFAAAVRRAPEVLECHMVAGGFDYLVKARVGDMTAYRRFLGETLLAFPGVRETRTYAVMEEVKRDAPLPVLESQAG